jgi:hypothetical protein
MQKLFIEPTDSSPEINFSPAEKTFIIRGNSAPEDVRAMYYPVIEWIKIFVDDFLDGEYPFFTNESPLILQVELSYFNSSSAKFLFDIFTELKRLSDANKHVEIEWTYEQDDLDQKEAGIDIASLVGMNFRFVSKPAGE